MSIIFFFKEVKKPVINNTNTSSVSFNKIYSNIKSNITEIKKSNSISSKDLIINNTYALITQAYGLKQYTQKINNEKKILNSLYYSTNNIVPINNYQILSDIGISYPTAHLTSMQNLSGKIYLTDPKSQYIYSISDINESTPKIFSSLNKGISIPQYITYSVTQNSLYLYDLNKGLLSIGLNGSLSPVISAINNANISYIQAYAGNVYLLDKTSGSVYAVNTHSLSYSKAFSSNALKGARSFAVDGNIFIINKYGNIVRFFNNQVTPFAVSNTNPMEYPLENLSFIYDNQYLNYIYLLDPEHDRIVVLQKPASGSLNTIDYKFVKQYVYMGTANKSFFSHMSAMALSSNGKYIYILSGNKVIKMSIS